MNLREFIIRLKRYKKADTFENYYNNRYKSLNEFLLKPSSISNVEVLRSRLKEYNKKKEYNEFLGKFHSLLINRS